MQFFDGKLRIDVLPNEIDFRAVGKDGEEGTEEALQKIAQLAEEMKQNRAIYRTQARGHGDSLRMDAVKVRIHPDRRAGVRGEFDRQGERPASQPS